MFPTAGDLEAHQRVPQSQICPLRDAEPTQISYDPEEGITLEVEGRLRDRTAKGQILDWQALWGALFPLDHNILPEGLSLFS